MKVTSLVVSVLALFVFSSSPVQAQLTITAVNKLKIARPAETIELTAQALAPLVEKDLMKLHVRDAAGKEVLCQAVDTDYDDYHKPDMLIFQADFGPNETKTFTVTAGKKREYTKEDFRAYGRFVRERFDDFAWENDRVAHRTYGKALITWKGEPLTSSAIDIWSKRTEKLVINDWYMVDNYHSDQGEGVDDYSAGPTRGCGGNGIWSNGQLYVPTNFVDSRVLTNGPIRVMFELVYEPFDVNGTKVSQVLRVSLDAGSQLNRFTPYFQTAGGSDSLAMAIGLKKVKDEQKQFNAERGWLTMWEPMEKNMGMQGLAIVVDPRSVDSMAEDKSNNLLVLKPGISTPASYWAGFAWDRAGKITTAENWNSYVDQFAERLRSPIDVSVKSAVVHAHAQQEREVPKEIRSKLFKQVMADYSDVRDCVEKEEGGTRAAEEKMNVEEVDVNRDGVPEYEVELSGPCTCGMVNCSIYLYRKTATGYESILEDAAGLGLELLKTSSNGYLDLQVDARETAATTSSTYFKYDGKQYRQRRATLTQVETGETKPASRRLQFKRGTSSTTVQGKVSIALPDTFVVGARAGQVMTIQLTAPSKSVRFMLMVSKSTASLADNTRSWTGTLPETGDYLIIVDADAKSVPYSMTVSIK